MMNIPTPELAAILKKFYCEARPKENKNSASIYHKNTLVNIRGAINRHIQDIQRDPPVDIVRDKEFKSANGVLDGLLKQRMRNGESKPTIHKPIIDKQDLEKISTYFKRAESSPIILRHCVWFLLSVHFVSRGLEFHHQLRLNSFDFHEDEHGEYAVLNHETQQKNYQGGILSAETDSKRMYATGGKICPLKMLRLLINKTDPAATHLFNQYRKESLSCPLTSDIWFVNKPLAKCTFTKFLTDICRAALHTPLFTRNSHSIVERRGI